VAYAGQVKGLAVNSVVTLLREEMGEAAFHGLRVHLPPESHGLLENKTLAVAWVPLATWLPFLSVVHKEVYSGDDWAFKAFARRSCARDFNLVYRMLLRLGAPATIIEKGAQVYGKYHQGAGTYRVLERFQKEKREYAVTRLEGFPPWELERYIVAAFIEQLLHMSAGRDVQVRERHCELTSTLSVEWESSWAAK
jgi:hypothetical protein